MIFFYSPVNGDTEWDNIGSKQFMLDLDSPEFIL